ncbi:PKD-like domain-containing protein, partial [Flavobacterium fluviatile]|uniref:glycine-rich domain-containing protein n=1 Tax=Flavobacterium fluviatile TaxID=1862387 RepID=UPI0013D4DBA9
MIKKLLIPIHLFFSKQNQNTPKAIATNLFGYNAKWLCFAMFLFANFSFGQSQTFISSGTFNVPAGVTSVTVQAWGGGGAGGGANNANATRNGGGGGGGAYTIRTVSVTPLSTIAVTVGAGGTGVTASDTGTNTGNGGDGGTSTFASTVAVVAAGGKGGEVGNSTHSDNGNGGAGGLGGTFNGGNGQNGSNAGSGGGGGSAGTAINGNNGTLAGAAAVTSGGAGAGGRNSNGPGISATTLGGGGGGGRMNNNSPDVKGGDGFRGQVLVTWTPCSTFSLTGTNTATAACTSTGTSTVTLVSSAAGLPVGSYTVTYNTDSPSQTGLTASMNVTNAGTGSFTATGLTNAGSRTITVTRLATSTCSFSITSNNTANVIVNPQPTIANAGPDQSTGSGSFILAANTPTIGTGVWSIASGPSTLLSQFSNTSSPTATFTPAVAGTYVLNWAISNSCGTFNDQVVVANNCVTNMISNSDFSGGATGWTFATTYGDRVEVNPENTYFSNGNSSITAELDSQASLRQVTTVIPGVSYTVSFRYARRSNAATPATTGVTVKITGGSTDLISTGFTTTSTISQIGTYTFIPTSSSIGLEFYNTLHGGITFGTIIDDIVLIPTSQVNPAATTSPKGVFNTLTSCAGVAVQLDVENVPASGVTYAWTGPAGAVFSSTTIKNPTVILTGSGVQQVSVTTTTAAGCSGSSITYINVTAAPTITAPVASSVCSGSTYSSGAISSTGTTFSWSRGGVANINGGAAGAGGTGIANATGFTEVLTNSTANPINVTYVLTPGPPSSGCSGTPYNLVVTVNPTVGIAITAPVAGSVCSG